MRIYFSEKLKKTGVAIVTKQAKQAIDSEFKHLEDSIKVFGIKGNLGDVCTITHMDDFDVVHVAGAGDVNEKSDLRDLGGNIYKIASAYKTVQVYVGAFDKKSIAQIAYGAKLASYTFNKYKTKNVKVASLTKINFVGTHALHAKKCYGNLEKISEGVFLARDLVSEPANVLTPAGYVEHIKALKALGVKVKVLKEKDLVKQGMGALLAVGQGSTNDSFVVVMEYTGDKKNGDPYVFVGKGVTFDTGGISIKPAGGMEDMKFDMGGSAAVVGAMKAIAGRKAKANVVGIVGLVENMPDGNATRPGDVVTSMDGQTIEVINTDAEGRMVLADCLTYAQKYYTPKVLVNLATLTGAMMVALGTEYAGVFSNDDALVDNLIGAGDAECECLWQMPMNKGYDKLVNSDIADMKNVGGRFAGAVTAAQFLKRFVNEDVAWAHIDIAGTAWEYGSKPTCPKGATGYGVRLLDRLVFDGTRK